MTSKAKFWALILHGGVVSSLIDTTGGLTAFSVLDFPIELTVNTVDMRVDYLRPARGKRFISKGKVIRKGKCICVTVIKVTNDEAVHKDVGLIPIRHSSHSLSGIHDLSYFQVRILNFRYFQIVLRL